VSNTAKGSTFEQAVFKILQTLKQHFEIEKFDDGKLGHITQIKGAQKIKLDIRAESKTGKVIIFSCKDTQEKPSARAVGELYISCENQDAKGYLVSTADVTGSTFEMLYERDLGSLVVELHDDGSWSLTEQLNKVLRNHFIGTTETVSTVDSLDKIVTYMDVDEIKPDTRS